MPRSSFLARGAIALAVALFSQLLASGGVAAGDAGAKGTDRAAFYVRYEHGGRPAVEQAIRGLGGRTDHHFPRFDTIAVSLPAGASPALASVPDVVFFEPVPIHQMANQRVPWNIDMVQARDVWDVNRDGVVDPGAPEGSGVKLCIIDSGLHATHEDFVGVTLDGHSQISGQTWFEDGDGHGTHVAGTSNAVHNDIGVVGVMPGGAELFIIKIFNNNGSWVAGQSNLGAAATRCKDEGANVISMSLSGGSSTTENNIFQDLYDNFGIVNVAAAANGGNANRAYPASYDSVISVAALKENEQVADFSQHPTTSYDPNDPPPNVHWDVVELSAGGQEVLSTWPYRVEQQVTVDGTTYHGFQIEEAPFGSHTALLADGGRCTATDAGWSGRLVLCERGDVTFATKINNVGNSGGLAAIIYNHQPGNFFGTCDGNCTTATPAISLSQEDGQILVATAVDLSGDFVSLEEATPEGGYYTISGTSMATPAVAAGVAWAWSACGGPAGITNKELRQLLRDSAKDLVGTREAGGSYGPGWDRYTGWGLIQLRDAFELGRQRFGATCPVQMEVQPDPLAVCTDPAHDAVFEITLGPDFIGTTSLSVSGEPPGATVFFSPNPVEAPATESQLTVGELGGLGFDSFLLTVRAEDAGDPTNAAEAYPRLDTFPAAPAVPELVAPADGAEVMLQPTLQWEAEPLALSYEVEVARDASFTDVVASVSGLTSSSHSLESPLDAETTYFWRVAAHNPCGTTFSPSRSFTTLAMTCDVYVSTDVPKTIPTSGSHPVDVTSVLTVPDAGTILDVDVLGVKISHTWVNDLSVHLRSPALTEITIMDRSCASENDIDINLDDEAPQGPWPCPPIDQGFYRPSTPLVSFDGQEASGTWRLRVRDHVRFEGGALTGWSLRICRALGGETPEADLAISKTSGQETAVPGESLSYTIVASNNAGPSSAIGATVIDTFPAALTGVTWICTAAGGAECGASSGAGDIEETVNLPVGGTVTYHATGTISPEATGTLTNIATVSPLAGVDDPVLEDNSDSDTVTLTAAPVADLAVAKSADSYLARVGEPLIFTVVVENLGPADVAGATVVDLFPAELEVEGWTCTAAPGASCTAIGTDDIDDEVGLPAGGSVTYVIEGTVVAGAFIFDNTARVQAPGGVEDPNEANDSATVTVVVCGGAQELALEDEQVTTSELYMASGTLTAGNGFRILAGGDVTFRVCGRVVLTDGFSVEAGRLSIEVESP